LGARLSAVVLPAVEDPEDGYNLAHPRYEYEYDDYGNLIAITDKLKQTPDTNQVDANSARYTRFTYNELGQQTSRKLPSGKVETKEYNALGQLIKSIDFKKQVIGYEYNDRGLLAVQAFYDSNSDYPDDPNWQYEFEYDNHGRRVTTDVNSFAGTPPTYKNYYDEQGRVHRIDSPHGTIRYERSDITGQVTSAYTPADSVNTEIDYYYDVIGRLAEVEGDWLNGQDANDIVTSYTYNPVGSLETVTYPNGNVSEYTYNAVNRLTKLTNWQSSAKVTPLSSYTYELSPDGQRTKATEVTEGAETVINWEYDDLNRLIAEDYNAPGDVNDYSHEYVYDIVGNRLERNVVGSDANTTYSYNDNDQLTWETIDSNTITYDYDDNGALVLRDSNDGDDVTYSYDLRGRLAQADIENGPTVEYLYNPDGIRVRATVDGNDIDYIIDPYNHTGYAQVLKEINGVTGTNRVYVTGLDVVAQATGSDTPKYLLYDGHGSVRQLSNNAGAITEKYNYDAYGNLKNFAGAPSTNLLYSGEWRDHHTGLYNNRARWYNPVNGRFNTMDPFGGNDCDPQSLHKYLYAHCNPINAVDPTGQWTVLEILAVVGIGLNLLSFYTHLSSGLREAWHGNYAESRKDFIWALVDLAFLCAPFSGGGPWAVQTAGSVVKNLTVFSKLGIAASALWGYVSMALQVGQTVAEGATGGGSGGGGGGGGGGSDGPPGGEFMEAEGPGKWYKFKYWNELAAKYQSFRNGKPHGWDYWYNKVRFDGWRDGKLLECKWNWKGFVQTRNDEFYGFAKDNILKQAFDQKKAASGLRVVWEFSDKVAADVCRKLLLSEGYHTFEVVYAPMPR
jgi:RHS repeat-associated protein